MVDRPLIGRLAAGLLAAFMLAAPVSAQVLVRGVVTDAQTGYTLMGATVQVEGTSLGAVTNVEGRFVLAVGRYPVRLLVRYIGYRSQVVELDRPPADLLEVALEPSVLELDELVVTDENVAEGIMRRAIARKRAWRDSIGTAYAEAYSRFILMREFDAVQVEETISAVWWKAGDGPREVVRARRTSPLRAESFRFAGPLPIPNLYDDTIEYEGTRFMGPLHPEAPSVYRFNLTDRRVQDGRQVFDIAFVPESGSSAAFTGSIAIEDSTFDALHIRVRPAVDRAGPPPVIERGIRMEQAFAHVAGSMQPVSFRADGEVRFGMSGVSYPTARFRQVAGLTLHAVEVPVPDTLFASDLRRRDAPDVDISAWLFDWNPGWVPPTADEAQALSSVAAAPPLEVAFMPAGLLRNYLSVRVVEQPEGDGSVERRVEWLRPWGWYNRVDGWHVGLRPEIRLGELWTIRPALGYAEGRNGVPWSVEAVREGPRGLVLSAGADELSAVVGESAKRSRFLLGLAAYGGWDDYFDYYHRRRAFVRAGWRPPEEAVGLDLTLSLENHESAAREDFYEGFLRRNEQRPNPPVEEGRLASLRLDLSAGNERLPGNRVAAYAGSSIEIARHGVLGSDFSFVRWSGAVALRVPTFYARRSRPPSLRVDLFAGLADKDTPPQREGFLHTAVGPLAPGAGFRASQERLPLSRQWLAVFWRHDFGPLLVEWFGMGESAIEVGIFGGHGHSSADSAGDRHELGLFIANLLGYPVRLYLASSLRGFSPRATVSIIRRY